MNEEIDGTIVAQSSMTNDGRIQFTDAYGLSHGAVYTMTPERRIELEAQQKAEEMVKSPESPGIKTGGLSTRFQPGNPGGPGRPRNRDREKAMLDAIKQACPPEQMVAYLQDAIRIAIEQNSARSLIAVLEFCANYTIGKPVQTIRQEESGLDWILAKLNGE